MSETCNKVEETLSIVECLSDDEEEAEIVILPHENTGEVTDEENDENEDDDGICEAAGEMEVPLQKEDKNSDDAETAPKKKVKMEPKYK